MIIKPLILKGKISRVYAISNIANYYNKGIIFTANSIALVYTSIKIDFAKAAKKISPFKQKIYKGISETQFVLIRLSSSVGQIIS
jgi:hypothetical protein